MKIRQGFVSNSSSSSFCIYGICTEEKTLIDALIAKGTDKDVLAGGVYDYFDNWSYNRKKEQNKLTEEDIKQYDSKFFKPEDGFETHMPYDYDSSIFLGVEWSNIKDDETGSDFKTRISAKLKDLLGKDVKCGTLEEAWRDG